MKAIAAEQEAGAAEAEAAAGRLKPKRLKLRTPKREGDKPAADESKEG